MGPATTPAARGRIVVCSFHGRDGDDVTKVNDLTSMPHGLKQLLEVLKPSVVFYADDDNVQHPGKRPGDAMSVHPLLHVDDPCNGSIGNAGPGPNVVVDEHTGADGEESMGMQASEPVGRGSFIAANVVIGVDSRGGCS